MFVFFVCFLFVFFLFFLFFPAARNNGPTRIFESKAQEIRRVKQDAAARTFLGKKRRSPEKQQNKSPARAMTFQAIYTMRTCVNLGGGGLKLQFRSTRGFPLNQPLKRVASKSTRVAMGGIWPFIGLKLAVACLGMAPNQHTTLGKSACMPLVNQTSTPAETSQTHSVQPNRPKRIPMQLAQNTTSQICNGQLNSAAHMVLSLGTLSGTVRFVLPAGGRTRLACRVLKFGGSLVPEQKLRAKGSKTKGQPCLKEAPPWSSSSSDTNSVCFVFLFFGFLFGGGRTRIPHSCSLFLCCFTEPALLLILLP